MKTLAKELIPLLLCLTIISSLSAQERPICNEADLTNLAQASQDSTELTFISSKLKRKTTRLRKKLGNNKSVDSFDENAEQEAGFITFNKLVGSSYFLQCANITSCANLGIKDITPSLATLSSVNSNLYKNALNRANKFQKALRKKLININGFSKNKAKRRAQKKADKYRTEIVEHFESAFTEVNFYIESFGTERIICDLSLIHI